MEGGEEGTREGEKRGKRKEGVMGTNGKGRISGREHVGKGEAGTKWKDRSRERKKRGKREGRGYL